MARLFIVTYHTPNGPGTLAVQPVRIVSADPSREAPPATILVCAECTLCYLRALTHECPKHVEGTLRISTSDDT
jgi:hypothetical protein